MKMFFMMLFYTGEQYSYNQLCSSVRCIDLQALKGGAFRKRKKNCTGAPPTGTISACTAPLFRFKNDDVACYANSTISAILSAGGYD